MLPVALEACGPEAESELPSAAASGRSIDSAIARFEASRAVAPADSRALPSEQFQPRTLTPAHPPPQLPAGRRDRVDVTFQGAELPNALRLLAEVGGFDLVVQEGVHGSVSVKLRRVVPYDALVALAETHGAAVDRRGNVVIVRAR
jgi:type IV pilus assembly protein PilQ